jgi:hypothetical protein
LRSAQTSRAGVTLPVSARWAALIGALTGILIPVVEKVAPRSRRWMPSAMGVGLGWVVFLSNALALTIGACIAWLWSRPDRRIHDNYNVTMRPDWSPASRWSKAFIAMAATALDVMPTLFRGLVHVLK